MRILRCVAAGTGGMGADTCFQDTQTMPLAQTLRLTHWSPVRSSAVTIEVDYPCVGPPAAKRWAGVSIFSD